MFPDGAFRQPNEVRRTKLQSMSHPPLCN